jgi:hypothetical protein
MANERTRTCPASHSVRGTLHHPVPADTLGPCNAHGTCKVAMYGTVGRTGRYEAWDGCAVASSGCACVVRTDLVRTLVPSVCTVSYQSPPTPLLDALTKLCPHFVIIICMVPIAPPFAPLLPSLFVPRGGVALGAYERGAGRSRTRTDSSFDNRCLRRPPVPCPRPRAAAQYTNVMTTTALRNQGRRYRGRQPTRPTQCHPERADCPRGHARKGGG